MEYHGSMEQFRKFVTRAQQEYRAADHLLYVSYPVVQESKMLAVITEKIYLALLAAMEALLYYEERYKRITRIPTVNRDKIELFKTVATRRYHFSPESAEILAELNAVVEKRQRSAMEFSRRGEFFIASRDYQFQVLSAEKVKKYMERAKQFMARFNEVAHGLS